MVAAAPALFLFIHIISLQSVDGVFPFPHIAHAQSDGDGSLVHDSSIDLLQAALNPDPNPNKGEHEIEVVNGSALLPHGDIHSKKESSTDNENTATRKKTGISIYTVQKGDSLSEIAEKHGVSSNTILWANDIRDAGTIRIGDELIILPVTGVKHNVASGETLQSIAKKYGSDVSDIALYNGIDEKEGLKSGTEIVVPGGAFPSATKKVAASGTTKKSVGTPPKPSGAASSGKFGNPLPGGAITQVNHGQNAVDIDGETGDPIYASAAGTVIIAKGSGYNGGYGIYMVIDHGAGVQTLYSHMSSLAVSSGSVGKGEVIGYVGSTGKSTGSHLHFEVRGATNPL